MKDLASTPLAVVRLIAYAVWTVVLLPFQMVAVRLGRRTAQQIPMLYHRGCCRILGLRIERHGMPVRSGPVLFVSNHCSYLDISVLGALIQGSFVAKTDVASWPLFGFCARLQRSVFVDRKRGTAAAQRDGIAERLAQGDNLVLFPEGTSSDGNRVLPFRSALLAVAESPIGGRPLTVQPVSVAYVRHSNLPMGRFLRPCYAWYGDMGLMGHLWRVMSLGPATVVVRFHAPVTIAEHADRKALTRYCHQVVSDGLLSSIHGPPRGAATSAARAPAAA